MTTLSTAISEKQPTGLYLLFFTELWERFGFYTVQTIVILYMTKILLMADTHANILYAAFSSLLYLTPTIGGYIADRYLGFQKAIILGGMMLLASYIVTALPGKETFFLGLSLLICGNGFFKPNVSSIVGELYGENDPRRDGGFTIFYMGINIGALIPPIIAGVIIAHYGWHAGFLLAALGMAIGQLTLLFFRKILNGAGSKPSKGGNQKLGFKFYTLLSIGTAIAVGLSFLALHFPETTDLFIEISAGVILLLIFFFLFKEPIAQRKRMFACLLLIIISIGFWALYNQSFTSLMLFADRNMETHILGIPMDAEATQFFNPFFIIALSPLLSRLWINLDKYNLNPSTQMKFSFGVLFMSAGYLLLAFGSKFFGHMGVTSAWWLAMSYFLQTIGELLLSPIGLAMITVLCPKHLVGMMMGVWFFSQAAAFAIGGMLANIAAVPAENSTAVSVVSSLAIYSHAFWIYGMIGLTVAAISFALVPFLNRMINAERKL
jgi:POT family proton-dependent oligopeptide transporter